MGFELLTKDELILLLKKHIPKEQEAELTSDVLYERIQRCYEEYDNSRKRSEELYAWFIEFCERYGSCRRISEKKKEYCFPRGIYNQNEHKIKELQKAQKEEMDLFRKWMAASEQWSKSMDMRTAFNLSVFEKTFGKNKE